MLALLIYRTLGPEQLQLHPLSRNNNLLYRDDLLKKFTYPFLWLSACVYAFVSQWSDQRI